MAYGTVNVPGVTQSELTAAVNEVRGERKDSVGGYIWKADTDKVYSKDAGGSFSVEHGSLADCKTDEYRGVWFRVQSSSSSAGIVAYDTKYTIDGANNYLSIGDYVIWTGSTLVHVPTYEAKASTVRNSDGQFAYHSGVDGLMSSTDKAYLTFLMQHFIAASMSDAFNSGDGTNESGLYGNVTLGRPSGSGEGDTYNMMSILDKVTNYTSQLLINESADNPFAYFRGRISGAWQRILSENDLVSHLAVAENDSDYPNWDNELRIYHVKKWAASSSDLPNSTWSSTGDYLVVNIPGAPNATTLHARTQFVMNNSNMEIWCRFIPSYSGSGSLAGGSPTAWVRLSGGMGHSHSNKTELDSITSTLISNWNAAYSHISNTNNPHRTNKSDVGLGNADNTSDMSKPVSNPQKEYIDGAVKSAVKAAPDILCARLLGYTIYCGSDSSFPFGAYTPSSEFNGGNAFIIGNVSRTFDIENRTSIIVNYGTSPISVRWTYIDNTASYPTVETRTNTVKVGEKLTTGYPYSATTGSGFIGVTVQECDIIEELKSTLKLN